MLYKHTKTGNIYMKLFEAMNSTNGQEEVPFVVYAPLKDISDVYVREAEEFYEKFEKL